MTPDDVACLRALLARGLFFPEARELVLLLLTIAERRKRNP